jgi:hypothetical protein
MIHEEICTYEVCKLAKEKGFREKCIEHYYDDTKDLYRSSVPQCYNFGGNTSDAPTQSLLQRWLREERGIIVEVFMDDDSNMPLTYNIHQYKDWNWECVCHHHGNYYAVNDWELCLEDALKYALENLV